MNRTKLKNYSTQARRDFIQAMTDRAAFYGLTAKNVEPIVEKGDVAMIAGRSHPRAVAKKRKQLENRIERQGFERSMEALAYTWFNRLVAIRFMELHGYLDHGYRVLSPRPVAAHDAATEQHGSSTEEGTDSNRPSSDAARCSPDSSFRVSSVSFRGPSLPEILVHAEHVDLPGMKKETIIDLKLAGNKEGELYRLLLLAQCNALHAAMPFLFEKIADETELLLPDNLLHSDSLIRKLVSEIDEDDWRQVEIVGWLYQFYISERKDEVIGKVVASEDIPAATQLFTPNWIVKYLVQNTLARQWLATYPQSALRQQMEYYIEPAEQTPEVQEQLKAITPASLNPEELTLLDPACGSGHILVEAYDLFKAIYHERGYRAKDIPPLILEKNLFGLEIDDRAAQLAAFALMMKARADDRRIFESEVKPNVLAFQESKGLSADEITFALNAPINKHDVPKEYLFDEIDEEKLGLFSKKNLAEKGHVSRADIASLLGLFEHAKTFGSLIQIPPNLAEKLPAIEKRLDDVLKFGNLTHASAHVLRPLLQQARLLARQYDAVVANPPYMGSKYYPTDLRDFIGRNFSEAKGDLYSCFIARAMPFLNAHASMSMITLHNWMFLPTWEGLRTVLLAKSTITSLVHIGRGVWGSDFPTCCISFFGSYVPAFRGSYMRLFEEQGAIASNSELQLRFFDSKPRSFSADSLAVVPGRPFAYWLEPAFLAAFAHSARLGERLEIRAGITTGNNDRYVRFWFEVPIDSLSFNSPSKQAAWQGETKKWFPLKKGGAFRKWYGNNDVVIRFDRQAYAELKQQGNSCASEDCYFRESLTWSDVSTGTFGVRLTEQGAIFSTVGHSIFGANDDLILASALLCSPFACEVIRALNPTWHANPGDVANIPLAPFSDKDVSDRLRHNATALIAMSRSDWNETETSPEFSEHPLLCRYRAASLCDSSARYANECVSRIRQSRSLEEENSRVILKEYGLSEIIRGEVAESEITLHRPNQSEDIKRLLSYAIGCMMGRYSLDKPGLIYAHSGNRDFENIYFGTERLGANTARANGSSPASSVSLPCHSVAASVAASFLPDDDGIVPLLETDWGIPQDAANRLVEFIGVAWPGPAGSGPEAAGGEAKTAEGPQPTADCLLAENLKFIADSLGPNKGEQPRETIRRYFATGFYKHHLSMYKRRPIYWLFSSGRERAFQCLVYLHRYHEGTLARMRTEYVIPLQGQIAARIEQLEGDKAHATSTSHRRKLQKEQDDLKKRQAELRTFEEKLKHAADQKIALDLDDGVKVNYRKFGDLLAEVKAVTGGKEDE